MKGIIYKYTFPDGKVYIGQTRRHPDKRKHEHIDKLVGPTNTGFWEAYNKFGEPDYEIIYEIECENVDRLVAELNILETLFIQHYRATNPNYGYNRMSHGYAVTDANSILKKKYNELYEEKIDSRLQVYYRITEKLSHRKAELTDEEKFLIKEKYRDMNPFQGFIDDFNLDFPTKNSNNIREMFYDEALPYIERLICLELQDEIKEHIYTNMAQIIYEERKKKTIVQVDKGGKIIKEYMTLNEVCQEFNVPRADNVINVLKGRQKTAYGFYWKYARDFELKK